VRIVRIGLTFLNRSHVLSLHQLENELLEGLRVV